MASGADARNFSSHSAICARSDSLSPCASRTRGAPTSYAGRVTAAIRPTVAVSPADAKAESGIHGWMHDPPHEAEMIPTGTSPSDARSSLANQ